MQRQRRSGGGLRLEEWDVVAYFTATILDKNDIPLMYAVTLTTPASC